MEEFAQVCVDLGMGDYDNLLVTITMAAQEELVSSPSWSEPPCSRCLKVL